MVGRPAEDGVACAATVRSKAGTTAQVGRAVPTHGAAAKIGHDRSGLAAPMSRWQHVAVRLAFPTSAQADVPALARRMPW